MENSNNNFNFDFSEAVVIKERINNLEIGNVRAATYGEKPSVTAREDDDIYALDFVLPLPDGCLNVDGEMSDTSTNPVSNAAVKDYIDSGKTTLTLIYANTVGKTAYSLNGLLEGYDLVICYASPSQEASPSCYCVPLRYIEDAYKSPMELQVSDNDAYTLFMLTRNGFYTEKHTGSTFGKIYAMYGVTFR
jgi:hypothetical protein